MEEKFCFKHADGKDVFIYQLKNMNGSQVLVTNYGAIITSYKIKMPDGNFNDIVLGFDDVQQYLDSLYLKQYPYFGAAIGRYANRIKNAAFKMGDREFAISKNWRNDQLHGGLEGFDKKVWDFVSFDQDGTILYFRYNSADGEEGFPGNLEVNICFELNDNDDLIYTYSATCDAPTIVNLTHHEYFNLDNGEGTVLDHEVKIYSDKILEQDENLNATGNYIAVNNTKFDFREFRPVVNELNGGYDQSFDLNKQTEDLSIAAEVYSKKSGLKLQILTTDPVVHFYTGQGIPKIKGKNNIEYGPYSGLCLETQKHPNAINIPKFPNTILKAGEKYFQKNVYKIWLPEK